MAAADITARAIPRISPALMAQLETRIERIPESGCWIWMAGVSERYGTAKFMGHQWLAHRLVYELLVGSVPADAELCHRCDIGFCVNPDHLFVGSHVDNMRDALDKGRIKFRAFPAGDAHHLVVIDDATAEMIGRMRGAGRKPREIAAATGVRHNRIRNLIAAGGRVAYVRGLRTAQQPSPPKDQPKP